MDNHTPVDTSASTQSAKDILGPSPLVAIENEAPAKLIVDPPLPEPLAQGRVFIQYRTENLRVLPVFGKGALDVSPRVIGCLHPSMTVGSLTTRKSHLKFAVLKVNLSLVPASFFGIILGLVGLGNCWRVAAKIWHLPAWIGELISSKKCASGLLCVQFVQRF